MEMSHSKKDHLTSVEDSITDLTCSFINNSLEGRNCHAAVRHVNDEHRIGFWSTANLSAGTELSFYYGKDFDYLFRQGQDSDESNNEELENEKVQKRQSESASEGGDALEDDEEVEPLSDGEAKEDDDYVGLGVYGSRGVTCIQDIRQRSRLL